ncbi:MAG: 3-methyl-2-oxobutanoate hydroxymethyltransferase [Dehalococcoidia bacterium]|nr:3-methyl-2-oxobutanoate hydroxymethyltransferase [Dehalococcoidia bacterium]
MRVTINQIKEMKAKGEKIPMLTAYDYSTARILDQAGIPLLLVGDSLGMVMLGYDSTIPVTMEDMIHHVKAVARGAQNALIIGDMPFMTYQTSPVDAMRNAGRFLQEGGAQAVKLEGGEHMAETVRRLVEIGIPVQGHIGLTPQSINQLGGYRVQGRTPEAARKLLNDAVALEEAGVFSLVLEGVPTPLAKLITERLKVPTIGIGAGPHCDGQVQVVHDMLGLYPDFVPKHAKQYAKIGETIREAVQSYAREVKENSFPTAKESYTMDEKALEGLLATER